MSDQRPAGRVLPRQEHFNFTFTSGWDAWLLRDVLEVLISSLRSIQFLCLSPPHLYQRSIVP